MAKRYHHNAAYYDAEHAHLRMLERDVPFLLSQMPKRRQSVLELAAGTGRAAIPLAQAGHRVVGVDYAADMLAVARRKRDAVGLSDRELKLVRGDVLKLNLGRTFDWVCILFNSFLSFTTLTEQDRLLRTALRHLKPNGRFWLDIFQPDVSMIADPKIENLEPYAFYVPELSRTVAKKTTVRRVESQVQRITFHYTWFDEFGRERRENMAFDLTFMFARELQLVLERNGLRVERVWGNYDGSPFAGSSPRLIARCCRA